MSRENNVEAISLLHEGPVQQNRALRHIIITLKALLSQTPPYLSINALDQIEVKFWDGRIINLSCALRNANFEYFFLSKTLIDKIQEKLKFHHLIDKTDKNTPTIHPLYPLEQEALREYTLSRYKEFNALLRGFRVCDESKILENFFYALLCVSAANKNVLAVHESEFEMGLYETLRQSDTLKRVVSDMSPGIFSTLSRKNHAKMLTGMLSFTEQDQALWGFGHTLLEVIRPRFSHNIVKFSAAPLEAEILFSPSVFYTREITIENGKTALKLEIVRGPDVQDNYMAELALSEAAIHHLLHPYSSGSSRNNHGVAHHARVMHYLDDVINYFLKHAANENFRLFCRKLSPEDIDIIKILLAFSKTGRESEISYKDDPKKYQEYQEASCKNTRRFFKAHLLLTNHKINFYIQILRYMGNPDFAKKATGTPEERISKIFINHMITLAHKLDLSRCYPDSQYRNALTPYASSLGGVVQDSPEQLKAFDRLIEIASKSIDLMGSTDAETCNTDVFYVLDRCDYARNYVDAPIEQKICLDDLKTVGIQQEIILYQKYEFLAGASEALWNQVFPYVFSKIIESRQLDLIIKSADDIVKLLKSSHWNSLVGDDRRYAFDTLCSALNINIVKSSKQLSDILRGLHFALTEEEYANISVVMTSLIKIIMPNIYYCLNKEIDSTESSIIDILNMVKSINADLGFSEWEELLKVMGKSSEAFCQRWDIAFFSSETRFNNLCQYIVNIDRMGKILSLPYLSESQKAKLICDLGKWPDLIKNADMLCKLFSLPLEILSLEDRSYILKELSQKLKEIFVAPCTEIFGIRSLFRELSSDKLTSAHRAFILENIRNTPNILFPRNDFFVEDLSRFFSLPLERFDREHRRMILTASVSLERFKEITPEVHELLQVLHLDYMIEEERVIVLEAIDIRKIVRNDQEGVKWLLRNERALSVIPQEYQQRIKAISEEIIEVKKNTTGFFSKKNKAAEPTDDPSPEFKHD